MDDRFKPYIKSVCQPMRPYEPGEDMTWVSISAPDKQLATLEGGMIACNPDNEEDLWYVAKDFFENNYIPSDHAEEAFKR